MTRFAFRPVRAEDFPALEAITDAGVAAYREFAPPGWDPSGHPLAFEPGMWWLVAEADGVPAGHTAFRAAATHRHADPDPALAHLGALFVHPDHHGSGLAAELMRRAGAAAAEQGYVRGRLFCAAGYARGRRFYEREGWRVAGEPFPEPDWGGIELVEYRRECGG